jgi:K+-transporting ATPase ATPase C chain
MKQLRPALVLTLLFLVFCGLVFPLVITGIAQVVFPHQANGSMVTRDSRIVGSSLIGQRFEDPKFFHPRPSSGGYDANNSGGTNLGPMNPKLLEGADGFDGVQQLAANYRALNGVGEDVVLPVDAVTRSASGLDPHISVRNAQLQSQRVARENSIPLEEVAKLVGESTSDRFLGLFGEPTVNVLELNMKLETRRNLQ